MTPVNQMANSKRLQAMTSWGNTSQTSSLHQWSKVGFNIHVTTNCSHFGRCIRVAVVFFRLCNRTRQEVRPQFHRTSISSRSFAYCIAVIASKWAMWQYKSIVNAHAGAGGGGQHRHLHLHKSQIISHFQNHISSMCSKYLMYFPTWRPPAIPPP